MENLNLLLELLPQPASRSVIETNQPARTQHVLCNISHDASSNTDITSASSRSNISDACLFAFVNRRHSTIRRSSTSTQEYDHTFYSSCCIEEYISKASAVCGVICYWIRPASFHERIADPFTHSRSGEWTRRRASTRLGPPFSQWNRTGRLDTIISWAFRCALFKRGRRGSHGTLTNG